MGPAGKVDTTETMELINRGNNINQMMGYDFTCMRRLSIVCVNCILKGLIRVMDKLFLTFMMLSFTYMSNKHFSSIGRVCSLVRLLVLLKTNSIKRRTHYSISLTTLYFNFLLICSVGIRSCFHRSCLNLGSSPKVIKQSSLYMYYFFADIVYWSKYYICSTIKLNNYF